MKYLLIIEADYNDGDYVTSSTSITEKKLKELKPVINALKKKRYHNWETGDLTDKSLTQQYPFLDEELLEKFNEYVPSGPDYGIHTIESILAIPEKNVEYLL